MKRPSLQWYPGDWLKDPNLGQCSPAARGVWMDLLSLMHENDQSGEIRGTVAGLSRVCRCSPDEMSAALNDLANTTTADVLIAGVKLIVNGDMSRKCPGLSPECPEQITVINRRMNREKKDREYERLRKQKQRTEEVRPRSVPKKSRSLSSSSSSSSSSSYEEDTVLRDNNDHVDPTVWAEFVEHRKAIRKPLGKLSATKNRNILEAMTPAQQRQAVDTTIANNWVGIFPPKGGSNGKTDSPLERVQRAYDAELSG